MVLAPFSPILSKIVVEEAPDGTMFNKALPLKFGATTPGWKGVPWAPTNLNYIPRSVWIIEGYPLDPYYNFGRTMFYVDKETYYIWLKEAYSRAGEFFKWVAAPGYYNEGPSGNNTAGDIGTFFHHNEKAHHGEVDMTPDPRFIFAPISRIGPSFYTQSNMMELSK